MRKDNELNRILNMEIGSTIVLRSTYDWEILIICGIGEYTAIENNYQCARTEQSRKVFKSNELDKLFKVIDKWV